MQVSDLHLGLHTGARRLRRVVRLIEQADPDILVSTGDLVDSPIARTRPLADLLREVKAPLGKFAVLGNHEYHAGLTAGAKPASPTKTPCCPRRARRRPPSS